MYGTDDHALYYCNGTGWVSIGGGGGGGSADNLGDHTATQDLDLATNKIINLATPTASGDAATKGYVDAVGGSLWTEGSGNVYRSTGNVGIGTASPGRRLEVESTASGEYPLRVDGVQGAIELQNAGVTKGYVTTSASFFNPGGIANGMLLRSEGAGIQFAPGGSGVEVSATMLPNGNVGIGTTSPTRFLQVDKPSGNAQIGLYTNGAERAVLTGATDGKFYLDTGGNTRMTVDGSGKVGIGTTSPSDDLHLHHQGAPSYGWGMRFSNSGGNDFRMLYDYDSPPGYRFGMGYTTGTPDTLVITQTGQVGVGTNYPREKLYVKGGSFGMEYGTARCQLRPYPSSCPGGWSSTGSSNGYVMCMYCEAAP